MGVCVRGIRKRWEAGILGADVNAYLPTPALGSFLSLSWKLGSCPRVSRPHHLPRELQKAWSLLCPPQKQSQEERDTGFFSRMLRSTFRTFSVILTLQSPHNDDRRKKRFLFMTCTVTEVEGEETGVGRSSADSSKCN